MRKYITTENRTSVGALLACCDGCPVFYCGGLRPTVVASAMSPSAIGDKVPDSYEDDCSDQGFDKGHTVERRIAWNDQVNYIAKQPHANECGDDSANNSEWEPPTNDEFCD